MTEVHGKIDTESRDAAPIPSQVTAKPPVGPMEKEDLYLTTTYAFAEKVHEHLTSALTFADQKAAFLFGVVGVVLAYLHTQRATRRWLMNPLQWNVADIVACVAVLGLAAGAILLLLAVAPRFGPVVEGLLYWKAIAAFRSPEDFADRVFRADAMALTRAQLHDSFQLAQICQRKYAAVRKGTWCSCVGLAATVLYIAFLN